MHSMLFSLQPISLPRFQCLYPRTNLRLLQINVSKKYEVIPIMCDDKITSIWQSSSHAKMSSSRERFHSYSFIWEENVYILIVHLVIFQIKVKVIFSLLVTDGTMWVACSVFRSQSAKSRMIFLLQHLAHLSNIIQWKSLCVVLFIFGHGKGDNSWKSKNILVWCYNIHRTSQAFWTLLQPLYRKERL